MRFSAPQHVSEVMLSTGPVAVIDGILDVPDDTPTADLGGLSANGFVLLNTSAEAPAPSILELTEPEHQSEPEEHPIGDVEHDA